MSGEHERIDRLAARVEALETEQRRTARALGGLIADMETVESATDLLSERLDVVERDAEPDAEQPDVPESGNSGEAPQIYFEIEYRRDPDSLWAVGIDPASPYASASEAADKITESGSALIEYRIVKVTREVIE